MILSAPFKAVSSPQTRSRFWLGQSSCVERERARRKPSGGCRDRAAVYQAPIKGCAQAREPHRCVVCQRSGITDPCAHLIFRYTVWSVSAAVAVCLPLQRFSVAMSPYVAHR